MANLLKGIKVIESAVLLTGDYVGMLLGDEGADVIKVESPGLGDYIRDYMGVFAPRWSPSHMTVNRNKRSVTLDLRKPEGLELFHRMLRDADVFVTGNVVDTTRKLRTDYDSLAKVKPDLVYCQATGFGAEGRFAEHPAHGMMMDALAGAVPVRWGSDGLAHHDRQGSTPTSRSGGGTNIGPLYAAYAVAAALVQRGRTGEGAYIDISCADSVVAVSWLSLSTTFHKDRLTPSTSFIAPTDETPDYNYYRAADGKFIIFCATERKFWESFCNALGREDLLDKGQREDLALRRELQSIFAAHPQEYWTELFLEHRVAAGPVVDFDDLEADAHMRHREVVLEAEHAVVGGYKMVGNPIRVRGQQFEVRHQAPALGEHTDEVLGEIGLADSDVRALRERGVV